MSAAIYIRWSTEDQGTGTTLEVQRDACLAYAADKGWTVALDQIFIDDGISGAKESRPALNRLNQAIQQGFISTVIVYKLDRLARQPYLAYKLVEKDWHKKASLISITEAHIDTTSTTGQLGFGIAAIFAAHERNTIRDRTMSGKRRRAAEGRNPGLRPPFGYAIAEKRFVVAEHEAVVVRRIYEEYLSGRTDGQIARTLNESGLRTRAGGLWQISAVQRVLTNPAYRGRLTYREITADGAFPVLIAPERWEHVQAMRRKKARIHPRRSGSDSPYILSGRLHCSYCGRPMNGRVCRNGTYEHRYYACTGYIRFRDCPCPTVRQEQLEGAVLAHLLPLLDNDEVKRRISDGRAAKARLLQEEIKALEARLAELDRELVRVRQDYRQARIDADTFSHLRTEIDADKAALADTLARKRASQSQRPLVEIDVALVWQELSFVQRKQVIHLLTERIEWDYMTGQIAIRSTL